MKRLSIKWYKTQALSCSRTHCRAIGVVFAHGFLPSNDEFDDAALIYKFGIGFWWWAVWIVYK